MDFVTEKTTSTSILIRVYDSVMNDIQFVAFRLEEIWYLPFNLSNPHEILSYLIAPIAPMWKWKVCKCEWVIVLRVLVLSPVSF